jgi:hypothetical protein
MRLHPQGTLKAVSQVAGRRWLWAALFATAGHALLLHALQSPKVDGPRAGAGGRAVLHRVQIVEQRQPAAAVTAERLSALAPSVRAVAPPVSRLAAPRPRESAPMPGPEPQPAPFAATAPPPQASATAQPHALPQAPAGPDPATAAEEAGQDLPAYAARLPPHFVMRLAARRGALVGEGELRFEPTEDGGYRIALALQADGRPWIELNSLGRTSESGVLPERFTDRRQGRSARATRFDRENGQIRYSGPKVIHALSPAAQDRVSWLVQLGAIAREQPALTARGTRLSLQVAGVYGDAAAWHFICQGGQGGQDVPAATDATGRVTGAVHCLREPARPYDTRVEVWLDPRREWLPARLRLTPIPAGEILELWRVDETSGS